MSTSIPKSLLCDSLVQLLRMGLLVLCAILLPESGMAQVLSGPGISRPKIPKESSDPLSVVSFDDELPSNAIDKFDQQVAIPGDVSSQLSRLQSQLHAQNNQIASLRRQLQMPSTRYGSSREPRWFTTFESVVVQPMQENTAGVIVETDSGYSHVAFPWKLQNSPRVQFGHESAGDSLGWRVRYWHFRHSKAFHANSANALLPVGNEGVVGFLSEDGDITVGLDFIEDGRFQSSIRTDVIDWELQRQVAEALDVYAGIRYAKVAQSYSAVTDQGNAWSNSSFRGIGPTVAVRLQHDLALNRLALFANVRGSLLFGHKEVSVLDDANNIQQLIGTDDFELSGDSGDTLSSNAEMQIGLRFSAREWLVFTVAFEAQSFLNVGGANPTGVFTGPDSGLAGDSPIDDSLSFAGVTVGSEVTW